MKMIIKGKLYEEDGSLYHHYNEEAVCIERERESCPTIKAMYEKGFWIIEPITTDES